MRRQWTTPLAVLQLMLLLLLTASFQPIQLVQGAANQCEMRGCPAPKPGHINLHVLSHSHNDAGWLDTLDHIYRNYVQRIYDSTTKALMDNRSRRYVSAENVFFSRWWTEQNATTRMKVRYLVESGKLQFVGGGWTQNDEAVTHYTAIIDQMTLGLRFLNDTFGPECGAPSVAWQADPFGHSVAQAALFAAMGFDNVMLGRVSSDKKDQWQQARTLEFVWKTDGSQEDGNGRRILAWVPDDTYNTPLELCLDWQRCASTDFMHGDESMTRDFLVSYARRQARVYTNDTVAMMSGSDLSFIQGGTRFRRQDRLIKSVNYMLETGRHPVYMFHSTPACYVEAMREAARGWPRYKGDLMPYTDSPGRTWTGFYTTRPSLKMMARYANGFLQACKQLSVVGGKGTSADVRTLAESVAVMQHHDAITGTSTDQVAGDYANMLYMGMKKCERVMRNSLVSLLDPGILQPDKVGDLLGTCHLLNQSDCPYTEETSAFTVLLYNSASVPASTYVRLPLRSVDDPLISVTGPEGIRVQAQVVPLAPHRHGIPESTGRATSSLVFRATAGPLGASIYRVRVAPTAMQVSPAHFLKLDEPVNYIENERYRVEFNSAEGLTASVLLRGTNVAVKLRQTFAAYLFETDVRGPVSPPGHYVFSAYREAQEMGDLVTYRVVKGPLVQEVHQIFTEYVSQVITLYRDSPFIDFTWTVGPLHNLLRESSQELTGCDIISKFQSDLDSSGFNTDSNGWKNVHRTVKIEEDKLPIPSNYYPVVSWIYIKDQNKNLKMLILPDRPQGGTSLQKGHVELMLHRLHSTNDNLGNPETLGEIGRDGQGLVVRGTHRLFLGSPTEARRLMRLQALQLVYRPLLVFAPPQWRPKLQKFSGLRWPLPSTVHILTLERLSARQVLLRLEHLALKHKAVKVNVTRLLAGYRLDDVRPVTLGANQFLPGPSLHYWTKNDVRGRPQRLPDSPMTAPEMTTVPATGDVIAKIVPGQIVTLLAELVPQ